jgi:hypothetical protein
MARRISDEFTFMPIPEARAEAMNTAREELVAWLKRHEHAAIDAGWDVRAMLGVAAERLIPEVANRRRFEGEHAIWLHRQQRRERERLRRLTRTATGGVSIIRTARQSS